MKEGELLIMVTDGILESQRHIIHKDQWLARHLRRIDHRLTCEEIAQSILMESLNSSGGIAEDDMMVLVARLVKDDDEIHSYRGTDKIARGVAKL